MQINTTLLTDDEKRLCLALSNEAKDTETLLERMKSSNSLYKSIMKNLLFDQMMSAKTQLFFINIEIEQREQRLLTLCHTGK